MKKATIYVQDDIYVLSHKAQAIVAITTNSIHTPRLEVKLQYWDNGRWHIANQFDYTDLDEFFILKTWETILAFLDVSAENAPASNEFVEEVNKQLRNY